VILVKLATPRSGATLSEVQPCRDHLVKSRGHFHLAFLYTHPPSSATDVS
jgi:hypothetical protein